MVPASLHTTRWTYTKIFYVTTSIVNLLEDGTLSYQAHRVFTALTRRKAISQGSVAVKLEPESPAHVVVLAPAHVKVEPVSPSKATSKLARCKEESFSSPKVITAPTQVKEQPLSVARAPLAAAQVNIPLALASQPTHDEHGPTKLSVPHERLYFADGDVILKVQNTTFHVHKELLANKSRHFRERFDIADSEDGSPICLSESAEEFALFLDSLYNGPM